MTSLKMARLPGGGPEVFETVQGEGVSAGVPAVFVRLSLCNLACRWCDTAYTWDWGRFEQEREIVEVEAEGVAAQVLGFEARTVVITGGEPMLQQARLLPVVERVVGAGRRVEVETNGTMLPSEELAGLVAQWNVSPKLSNSGNAEGRREVAHVLEWFAGRDEAWFKFVVVSEEDLGEVEALVARHGIRDERVILMPEGTDAATLTERGRWLAEACAARGWRFSSRLHVLLWGDERGR